jgi:hypothetical protein
MAKAAMEWLSIYPNDTLGSICASNIVISTTGQIRVVCRLTFLNNDCTMAADYLPPPDNNNDSKFSLNPFRDQTEVERSMVHSMGMVVL